MLKACFDTLPAKIASALHTLMHEQINSYSFDCQKHVGCGLLTNQSSTAALIRDAERIPTVLYF